jgi:hypothetical protein
MINHYVNASGNNFLSLISNVLPCSVDDTMGTQRFSRLLLHLLLFFLLIIVVLLLLLPVQYWDLPQKKYQSRSLLSAPYSRGSSNNITSADMGQLDLLPAAATIPCRVQKSR